MSRVDYSKWDHIEISDDEDDTHPNIDTPSLFRWRHTARLDRMESDKKEKEDFLKDKEGSQRRMVEIKKEIKDAEANQAAEQLSKLNLEMKEIEKQTQEWVKKEEELKKKERLTPLNIDTICKETKSKTIINKYVPDKKTLTEDEQFSEMEQFHKTHEAEMKKFGMFKKYEDSEEYLKSQSFLVSEHTANYLVIWCINLEMEEKRSLMGQVAHQTIIMQFILELARSLKMDDPRQCIKPFFTRIKLAEKQYMDAFDDELRGFKQRVKARAKARIDAAVKELEEEERQKRIGPGGLDPVEVFEELPQVLKDCFESKDIGMLQEVIAKMSPEDAELYMKKCVDSGLWVPNAADMVQEGGDEPPVYEEVAEQKEETK